MKRRIAALAFLTAALYGGFFMGIHRKLDTETWPEW